MKKIGFCIIGTMLLLLGCTDELDSLKTKGRVNVTLCPVPETVAYGSRAVTADVDETAVKDVWVLVYDNANGSLKTATYNEKVTDNQINVTPPKKGSGKSYTVILVANTHNPYLFNKDSSDMEYDEYKTLAAMKSCSRQITGYGDLYEKGTTNNLMLNGFFEMKEDFAGQTVKLYRNVAKLTLTVNNTANSKMTISSIKICNVPNKLIYADQYAQNVSEMEVIDFSAESDDILPSTDENNPNTKTYTYYLPRNCQDSEEDNATYVEVKGTVNGASKTKTCTFYLKNSDTGEYNVIPNHSYNMTINAAGLDMTNCANCYMIDITNPPTTLEIPINQAIAGWSWIIDNVNLPSTTAETRATGDDGGGGTTGSDNGAAAAVAAATEAVALLKDESSGWSVESEWLDNPGLAAVTGKRVGNKLVLTLPTVSQGANCVVHLKHDDVIYWSWHLWFTDYKPGPDENGDYTAAANMNGQVHAYFGYAFTNTSGIYYNGGKIRKMMDRNLGATITGVGNRAISPENPDNKDDIFLVTEANAEKFYGLYYAWGRKDPIATTTTTLTSQSAPRSYEAIVSSIKEPAIFFEADFWVTWAPAHTELWHGVDENQDKSPFDPCPLGWRVPLTDKTGDERYGYKYNPWGGFGDNDPSSTTNFSGDYLNDRIGYRLQIKQVTTTEMGGLYYYEEENTPTIAWYPCAGYFLMTHTSDANEKREEDAMYWGASYSGESTDNCTIFKISFDVSATSIGPSYGNRPTGCFSVRCIRDKY